MQYDPVWSVLLVEGDYKYVVVGRESGAVEKYRYSDLSGKPVLSLKTAHKGTVTTLVQAPAGGDEVYSASVDKTICQWNLTDDTEQLEAQGGKRLMMTKTAPDALRCGVVASEMLCCGGADGAIHALREGALERWPGHTDAISCVAQVQTENGDGILASGSYDGKIRLWNTATGVCIYLLAGHTTQIKGVQFINGHLGVVGFGRDETMRLWLMPEVLNVVGEGGNEEDEGAAANEAAEEEPAEDEEGEDAEGNTRSGAYTTVSTTRSGPKPIDCSAIIALPAAPLCVAVQPESESPLLAVGLSGGGMVTVKANKFYTAVNTFIKINKSEVKKERKRLDVLLKGEEKKETLARKKALRKKKKELVEEQQKEEGDKKTKEREERAAARKAARDAARDDEDEEGEEAEEEPEEPEEEFDEEEEEGEGVSLTEERQKKLDDFKEEQKKSSDERMKALRTSVAERRRVLDPIDAKKYERDGKQFNDVAFTRYHPRAAADSITAVALAGTKVLVASGSRLAIVDGTPGVQSI